MHNKKIRDMGVVITVIFIVLILSSINRTIKRHIHETDIDTIEPPYSDTPWNGLDRPEIDYAEPEEVVVNYDRQSIETVQQYARQSCERQLPYDDKKKRSSHNPRKEKHTNDAPGKHQEQTPSVMDDFDIRKAIVYAEIMKPKYKEY